MARRRIYDPMIGLACILAAVSFSACNDDRSTEPTRTLQAAQQPGSDAQLGRLQHIVVIYLENHSFDNLYGEFAGANGLSNASGTTTQVDATGTAFTTLPVNAGSPFPTTLT